MCKNFIMTNVSQLTDKAFLKLRCIVAGVLTQGSDNDGFGYAALNDAGEVFGERWLDVKEIEFQLFKGFTPSMPDLSPPAPTPPKDLPAWAAALVEWDRAEAKKPLNFFGTYGKPIGAFLAHARLATNAKCIENTHPHRTDSYTLIHNGVVKNIGPDYKWQSTCDTEFLVTHLSVGGIDAMVAGVTGNFAIGALVHATQELIIAKDSTSLYHCYHKGLKTDIICTSKAYLEEILKEMGWAKQVSKIRPMQDNKAWTFNVRGALTSEREITPVKQSSYKTYVGNYGNVVKDPMPAQPTNVVSIGSNAATRAASEAFDNFMKVNDYDYYRDDAPLKSEADVQASQLGLMDGKDAAAYYNTFYRFMDGKRELGFAKWIALSSDAKARCVVIERESGMEVEADAI